jgi:hypothetical protein
MYMDICVFIYICIYMYIYVHLYMSISIFTCVYIYIFRSKSQCIESSVPDVLVSQRTGVSLKGNEYSAKNSSKIYTV